jgi:hypothetical protein
MDSQECIWNAIGAWDAMRQRLTEVEGELRASMVRYAECRGPRPERLFYEAMRRQRDCETALRAVLDAIDARDAHRITAAIAPRDPRDPSPSSSGVN